MKKNLFFAALTAVALSAGLTSCSDDDDSNNNACQLTFQLLIDNPEVESAEYTTIKDAYCDAFGVSHDDALDNLSFAGKDSAACAEQCITRMQKAEASLSSKNWDETTFVSVYLKGATSQLYGKLYASVDNSTVTTTTYGAIRKYTNGARCYDDGAIFGIDEERWAVSGVYVDAVPFESQESRTRIENSTWQSREEYKNRINTGRIGCRIMDNVNNGNEGDYVAISFKWRKIDETPVTDIIMVYYNADQKPVEKVRHEDRTYTLCHPLNGGNAVHLNQGVEAKNSDGTQRCMPYYLYQTYDDCDGRYIHARSLCYFYTKYTQEETITTETYKWSWFRNKLVDRQVKTNWVTTYRGQEGCEYESSDYKLGITLSTSATRDYDNGTCKTLKLYEPQSVIIQDGEQMLSVKLKSEQPSLNDGAFGVSSFLFWRAVPLK